MKTIDCPTGLGLTPNQAFCVRVIAELTRLEGRPPDRAAIAEELCIRPSGVTALLARIGERGWLKKGRRLYEPVLLRELPPLEDFEFELTELGWEMHPSLGEEPPGERQGEPT